MTLWIRPAVAGFPAWSVPRCIRAAASRRGPRRLRPQSALDTPGCWQVPCVVGSSGHAWRPRAGLVAAPPAGAALIAVRGPGGGGHPPPAHGLGPSVIGGVAAAQPFGYVP